MVVLVTRAEQGLGRAVALALAAAGHVVFAGVPPNSRLEDLPKINGVVPFPLDVEAGAARDSAIERMFSHSATLDAIIHIADRAPEDANLSETAVFNKQLWSPLSLTRKVLPPMIASRRGLVAWVYGGDKSASPQVRAADMAVSAVIEALRGQLAPMRVRVASVDIGKNWRWANRAAPEEAILAKQIVNLVTGRPPDEPESTQVSAASKMTAEPLMPRSSIPPRKSNIPTEPVKRLDTASNPPKISKRESDPPKRVKSNKPPPTVTMPPVASKISRQPTDTTNGKQRGANALKSNRKMGPDPARAAQPWVANEAPEYAAEDVGDAVSHDPDQDFIIACEDESAFNESTDVARRSAWIVDESGRRHPLIQNVNRVGRGRENEVQILTDARISRLHFVVVRRNGNYYVESDNAANGTYIGEVPITSLRLHGGEYIKAGDTTFLFELGDDATTQAKIKRNSEGPARIQMPGRR